MGSPDFPLPGHLLSIPCFHGDLRHIISPACPGSVLGPTPQFNMSKIISSEASGGILTNGKSPRQTLRIESKELPMDTGYRTLESGLGEWLISVCIVLGLYP